MGKNNDGMIDLGNSHFLRAQSDRYSNNRLGSVGYYKIPRDELLALISVAARAHARTHNALSF